MSSFLQTYLLSQEWVSVSPFNHEPFKVFEILWDILGAIVVPRFKLFHLMVQGFHSGSVLKPIPLLGLCIMWIRV